LLVLSSNQFLIVRRAKVDGDKKWRDLKTKKYDFSQVKGDFINMISLKQYQRENVYMDHCSSIWVSLHMGC